MDTDTGLSFGDLLRRQRDMVGLTQEDLAERTGLTSQAISLLERGERRRPQRYTVQKLAEALFRGLSRYADRSRLPRSRPAATRSDRVSLYRPVCRTPKAPPHLGLLGLARKFPGGQGRPAMSGRVWFG